MEDDSKQTGCLANGCPPPLSCRFGLKECKRCVENVCLPAWIEHGPLNSFSLHRKLFAAIKSPCAHDVQDHGAGPASYGELPAKNCLDLALSVAAHSV